MLEWLICAAGVAAQAVGGSGVTSAEDAQADFLEFLADWDESESMALDDDSPVATDEEEQGGFVARSAEAHSPANDAELLR